MRAVFLQLLAAGDKERALRDLVENKVPCKGNGRFDVELAQFVGIPRAPFSYWVGRGLLAGC